jgi:serine protease Do
VGDNDDELKKNAVAADEPVVPGDSGLTPQGAGPRSGYTHFAIPTAHKDLGQRGDRSQRAKYFSGVALIVVGLSSGFLGGWYAADRNSNPASPSTQKEIVSSEGQLINSIAKKVGPSIVSINVTSQTTSATPFGFAQTQPQESAGTGIIISANGLVITNRHVVPQGTSSVSVTLSDGTQLDNVKVIGRTNTSDSLDVAFLKIGDTKGKKLTAATLGDSSKVQVGDRVVAIGNALGQFQNTVTSGIISGHGRTVQATDQGSDVSSSENLQDLLQTDAAINSGNSGGPLVNASGEVIGINTAVAGNAQSIGFAIPINDVSGLVRNVLKTGKFQQPYLGVRYVSLTNDIADQLKIKTTRGAYVIPAEQNGGQNPVLSGSPAAKAGLKGGDIIQAVNGANIDDNHSLTALLDQHSVGDTITLKVLRDGGKTENISVTLSEAQTNTN